MTPAFTWPLRLPVCRRPSRKIFRHWTVIQNLGRSSSFLIGRSVNVRWPEVSEYSLRFSAGWMLTGGQWMNVHSVIGEWPSVIFWIPFKHSTFLSKPSTFLSSCNVLILLRIFKFTVFRSTFFAFAIFMPKSPKKYFARNPQWFQYVTDFLFWRGFWHRPCNTYRRTWRKPSVYGWRGWQPVICHRHGQWGRLWHRFPYAS